MTEEAHVMLTVMVARRDSSAQGLSSLVMVILRGSQVQKETLEFSAFRLSLWRFLLRALSIAQS